MQTLGAIVRLANLLCLLLAASGSAAQQNTFSGRAKVKDGDIYPYQFTFNVKGSHISGYSITKQPDGTDLKARIEGAINKKVHTISFKEVGAISETSPGITTCMFSVALTYQLKNGKYYIKGQFTGKDNLGAFCGSGTMEFEQADKPGSPLHEEQAVATTPKVPAKDTAAAEIMPDANKITTGTDKQIEWHTSACTIAVWDGGVTDGDKISILLNGTAVLTGYTLTKEHKVITLPVSGKKNTITIVAEDEGSAPPNTAQIMLTDGREEYRITAYNHKGKTANIIIVKNQ